MTYTFAMSTPHDDCENGVLTAEEAGLTEQGDELVGRELIAEVDEDAVDRRDRDAAFDRHIARVKVPRRVHSNTWERARSRRNDSNEGGESPCELVQLCRGHVAQDGAGGAGEDRRHPLALARERRVADRVHAAVATVENPPGDPLRDRGASQARRGQLGEPDHTVLARGEGGERLIGRGCPGKVACGETLRLHPLIVAQAGATDLHAIATKVQIFRADDSGEAAYAVRNVIQSASA